MIRQQNQTIKSYHCPGFLFLPPTACNMTIAIESAGYGKFHVCMTWQSSPDHAIKVIHTHYADSEISILAKGYWTFYATIDLTRYLRYFLLHSVRFHLALGHVLVYQNTLPSQFLPVLCSHVILHCYAAVLTLVCCSAKFIPTTRLAQSW